MPPGLCKQALGTLALSGAPGTLTEARCWNMERYLNFIWRWSGIYENSMYRVSGCLKSFMMHSALPDLWQDSKLRLVSPCPRLAPWPIHKSYTCGLKTWAKHRTGEIQLKFPYPLLPKRFHTGLAAVLLCSLSSEFLLKEGNGGKGTGEAYSPPPANFCTVILMEIYLLLIEAGHWAHLGSRRHGLSGFGGGLGWQQVPSALTASAIVHLHFPGGVADWGKENRGFVGWRSSQADGEVKWKCK